ncbi:hypothetical protein PFICI_03323 [Pestalotiopsis fici W106-1]|uniref:Cytochrome P450 n=1 Tax=Pestalotiopsis fici (strain W106-1 / CGMCC3.15140) TaxID=1229662 RepID=W3XGU0_PESFW|nr:uncharacterized protein PFICI_03323 [Pestalotiopsis fici W106-1]ETS85298.1 hypothetical protein PFICI_03323 [Pestalotiopsis fici W106-1]
MSVHVKLPKYARGNDRDYYGYVKERYMHKETIAIPGGFKIPAIRDALVARVHTAITKFIGDLDQFGLHNCVLLRISEDDEAILRQEAELADDCPLGAAFQKRPWNAKVYSRWDPTLTTVRRDAAKSKTVVTFKDDDEAILAEVCISDDYDESDECNDYDESDEADDSDGYDECDESDYQVKHRLSDYLYTNNLAQTTVLSPLPLSTTSISLLYQRVNQVHPRQISNYARHDDRDYYAYAKDKYHYKKTIPIPGGFKVTYYGYDLIIGIPSDFVQVLKRVGVKKNSSAASNSVSKARVRTAITKLMGDPDAYGDHNCARRKWEPHVSDLPGQSITGCERGGGIDRARNIRQHFCHQLCRPNDPSSHVFTFAVYFLSANPSVQYLVAKELRHVLGDRPPEQWDYNKDFPRLKRCLAILYESIRLYTPVPVTKWTAGKTQTLNVGDKTLVLPPNTMMCLTYSSLQTDPRWWGSDSLTWRPSRFIKPAASQSGSDVSPLNYQSLDDEEFLKPRRGSFVGWSKGARDCPGRKFSHVEFVATIASIFRDWRVDPVTFEVETIEAARRRVLYLIETESAMVLLVQMLHPEKAPLAWSKR